MSIKRISAIVPSDMLTCLEDYLRDRGVPGVTVEMVKGYGKHPNFFRRDLMLRNARVILYVEESRVDPILEAITRCARHCGATSGVVAVEHIERLVSLVNGEHVSTDALNT